MLKDSDNSAWRVGVDTGGTFTDFVLVDPKGVTRACCKVLSTPKDPAAAVIHGLDLLFDQAVQNNALKPQDRDACQSNAQVVHGSTVATNALLENKTDAAVLLTTAGFEDLLLLARQDRPELYALSPRIPPPPIPRDRTLGVHERVAYDGKIITTLTQHEVERIIDQLKCMRVDSLAICLLHSYANPSHERLLASAVREHLPAVHLTVSSELLPELREYERAATCAANAVIAPTMARYIGRLDEHLGRSRLRIMASGGGTLPPRVVIERPVETVMSGPAGGILGAWAMARQADQSRIIGFDMGGTSTDVALCDRGPAYTNETTINSLPIRLPMIDLHTVGAGGGSIAWIDDGGALRVGPQSAGADPGPACYGRQGENPCLATVTDAHAVLGHLREGRQLGEALKVDTSAARYAVGKIAKRLGLSIVETAEGILRVADAAMARAIQRVSVQRGHDARGYTLVAFGGAGGLHACRLADLLGMTRVLIPVHSGLLSAFGMLAAPPRYAFSQAVLERFEQDGQRYPDPRQSTQVQQAIEKLRERGVKALLGDGIGISSQQMFYALDLRFAGQSYEITVPCDGNRPVIERFIEDHQRLYGYAPVGKPVELIAARVEALGPALAVTAENTASDRLPQPRCGRHIEVFSSHWGNSLWNRVDRELLNHEMELPGLVVLEEYAGTTIVPRSWKMRVCADGQLLLQKKEESLA